MGRVMYSASSLNRRVSESPLATVCLYDFANWVGQNLRALVPVDNTLI